MYAVLRYGDGEDEPLFDVGDRVIVEDPNDFFGEFDTTVYEVSRVKYSEKHRVFVYQLSGGSLWINETWLKPDVFGPQYIAMDDNTAGLLVERDYMLLSLHDAISTQNEAEAAGYIARLREIHTELEALK